MFLKKLINKKITFFLLFFFTGLTISAQEIIPVKTVTQGNNLLATLLIITAIVLLLVIWGMGQALITLSRQLLDKHTNISKIATPLLLIISTMVAQDMVAQDTVSKEAVTVTANYGGLSVSTFYCLAGVIATEVVTILFLFFCIRRIYTELVPERSAVAVKESKLVALWAKLNKKLTRAIPLEQEADALLDHDYDGIRELDNALPPWWKYGFILTIGFAIIYLLNFHVTGNGKNPTEEYAVEMNEAMIEKEAYEAKNKDKIDEANVPMANAAGIKQGQEFFIANCIACHGPKGEGGAGPNLTDDYWLHKGSLNDIYNTIKKGYPDKGMQSWAIKFNPKEISELASYVSTLKGTNPPGGKAPQGDLFITTAVIDSLKTNKPVNQVTIK